MTLSFQFYLIICGVLIILLVIKCRHINNQLDSARQTIHQLKTIEHRYRHLFDQAPVMYVITQNQSENPVIVDCNALFCETLGYEKREIIHRNLIDFYDEESVIKLRAGGYQKALEGNFISDERRLITRNGKPVDTMLMALPDYDDQDNVIGTRAMFVDITEKKAAEAALKMSEEKYRLLFENAQVFISVYNRDGVCLMMNKLEANAFGGTPDRFIGKRIDQLHPQAAPEYLHRIQQVMDANESREYQDVVVFPTGNRHLLSNIQPIKDATGNVYAAQIISQDITDRVRAEEAKKQLEAQLQHAEKMESIGRLAGGIAHDFNNLLMGIQGRVTLIQDCVPSDHPVTTHAGHIEQYVKIGADLTRQLLAFAKGGKYDVRPLDLNKAIDKSVRLFGRTWKHLRIHQNLHPNLPAIEADPSQIDQVLLNLLVNAGYAMPDGGEIYLETERMDGDSVPGCQDSDRADRYVRLSVTDTGIGMDPEVQKRVFDPFFTTRQMGRGTGLGLATVYGIVKGYQGVIQVHSEPDHGTRFDLYFPASDKPLVHDDPRDDPPAVQMKRPDKSATVLIIDDEPMVLDVAEAMVKLLGYDTLTASSGEEALKLFENHDHGVDLVILDMIMPGMSGEVVFKRLKQMDESIKIVISSGYSLDKQTESILNQGCAGFLKKPFKKQELANLLTSAMGTS